MQREFVMKALEFILYTLLIYSCYISSGVYHQKILKHQYISDVDASTDNFQSAIIFTFFPQVACTIIGFVLLTIGKYFYQKEPIVIPAKKVALCSLVCNINMLTYNQAVIQASFPAVVMVKSCSLLSVILIAIFCSRVKDKSLKLGKSKIVIGVIVTVGIILFNLFKTNQGGNDKPITFISSGLLLISLLGDGFLPDLQAQIKSQYKPGVIDMYYNINKYTALIALAYATVTFQLPYIYNFIADHSQLQQDLIIFSLLNAFGQLVIYQMIKLFKQHIPSFVIATRKCFTVIVNIVHFGHQVNGVQGVGMCLVFTAVMMEVYQNYKEKMENQTKLIKPVKEEDPQKQSMKNQDTMLQDDLDVMMSETKQQVI